MSEPVRLIPPVRAADDEPAVVVRDNTEAVYTQLRHAILRCDIPSGVPISQVQLAEQLGVSRTPLREALRMLQREGLIEGAHNQRVRVAGFSVPDLEQLYATRIALEALVIRVTVPQLSEDELYTLGIYLKQMDVVAAKQEYEQWNVLHRAFHAGLVAYGGARLLKEIANLSDHAERYRHFYTTRSPGSWAAGAAEHQAILDACVARNSVLAAEQLARHYSTVALRVLAMVEPEHDPYILRTALRMVINKGD